MNILKKEDSELIELCRGKATAFSGDVETSKGEIAKKGTIGVNPKKIAYGTKLIVKDLDGKTIYEGVASETGGELMKDDTVVNLWFKTEKECEDFGRKDVVVYSVKKNIGWWIIK